MVWECAPAWFDTMRILFINPNITSSITELMAAEARRSAAAGTELERWLRFFEQNFCVDKWELLPGLGAARVSLS